jgi:hypothetical protein
MDRNCPPYTNTYSSLESEPKMLVDVSANTYEETKKILHARYGDKNCIIQAHLDYLEDIKPIQFPSAEELNTTHIECIAASRLHVHFVKMSNAYGRVLAP